MIKEIPQYKNIYKRFGLLNRYYKITQFYSFLKAIAYKGGLTILLFVGFLAIINYFFVDIDYLLNIFVTAFSSNTTFGIFLVSETFLGLIPPEIFIAWSAKSSTPWLFLFTLATISYIAGIISYFIGRSLFTIPKLNNYIKNKISNHIVNLKKWGGFFVVLGALTPLPHSVISMTSGLIGYNFKYYVLWALFRYLRFVVYGLIIFQVF